MLLEDILLAIAVAVVLVIVGRPIVRFLKFAPRRAKDPLAEAHERLRIAKLEAEAARVNREAEKIYEHLYEETLSDDLALETAKLNAQQTVTTAKADADAKKLAVQANNNFQERISAYVKVMEAWATAYGAQRQTPDVQLGGGGAGGTAAAMDILAVKAARDLQVQPKP
jgi:hypothetical protein